MLRLHAARLGMVEVHRQQLAALLQRLVDQPTRHLQIALTQLPTGIVARHFRFQAIFSAQQQKAALGAGYGQRRIHYRR
jgi:hypothetical protein